jgi:hypothetical protein
VCSCRTLMSCNWQAARAFRRALRTAVAASSSFAPIACATIAC